MTVSAMPQTQPGTKEERKQSSKAHPPISSNQLKTEKGKPKILNLIQVPLTQSWTELLCSARETTVF